MRIDAAFHNQKRSDLIERIKLDADGNKWVAIFSSGFEDHRFRFRPESSFYYLTGLTEPGLVLCVFSDGRQILYVPSYQADRGAWTGDHLYAGSPSIDPELEKAYSSISFLGSQIPGYVLSSLFDPAHYKGVSDDLEKFIDGETSLFVLHDHRGERYVPQMALVGDILDVLPVQPSGVFDISGIVHDMRRSKSEAEVLMMFEAVQSTMAAQTFVARTIKAGAFEYDLKAGIEAIFTTLGCSGPSFPTIVATGINATRLHYTRLTAQLCDGELTVVDIGAEFGMYAADLTRTFPVSGLFTPRQKELYEIVLAAQKHVEQCVKPGMYLVNTQEPEKSLHHIARAFFEKHGLEKYFIHGIGHFLGLDVHDVGDARIPLRSGDAFTIEPGLYIPEEGIGIRIEDNYVLADDGLVCLSEELPKTSDEIEKFIAERYCVE